MTRIGNMDSESGRQNLAPIRHAIAIRIAQLPDIRSYRRVDVTVVPQHACGDTGDFGFEILRVQFDSIRFPIAIGIFHAMDFFAQDHQIPIIVHAIPIVIGDPLLIEIRGFERDSRPEKGPLLLHARP